MTTLQRTAFLTILISLLSGCTATSKESLLPSTGPTMEEVYRGHVGDINEPKEVATTYSRDRSTRPLSNRDEGLTGYTRDANNEIQSIFPQLNNPTLVMYVFPHLSTESRLPVPGYATSFTMYEKAEYALPGEM